MQRHQLDRWVHSQHKDNYQPPKVYVIGCADITHYLLAVEYKHKLEPIRLNDDPIHFSSLESVKEELLRLGISKAYLRLHNAYDECGSDDVTAYHDIELSLTSH